MAKYDPPEPVWKRVVVFLLDFVLAFAVFAILTAEVAGTWDCPAAVLARVPGAKCVNLSLGANVFVLGLTIVYFVVLGGTGGTVFERFFGMRRAKQPNEVREIVKIIGRPDGKRRVLVYRRQDGRFAFYEEQRLTDMHDEPRWRSMGAFEAICDSAEAAEMTARASIGWLSAMT